MTPAKKTGAIQDVATLELWRAAENGDLDELATLLPRGVDINACNEHGVTALMRAAQHGHARMVRALLQHGADANIKRNDKFTALALAAFFGHTEVVRTLMAYGADSQASTRHGTSPQMWATARTFNAVVKSLEKPAPAKANPVPPKANPVPVRVSAPAAPLAPPTPVPEPAAVRPAATVIRTLKDPPEIWDLVHEVPRGFDARSAFMTRLKSMRNGWAFRVAAAMIVVALSALGVLVLRNVQARNEQNSVMQTEASPQRINQRVTQPSEPVNAGNNSQPINNNNEQPATAALPEAAAESTLPGPTNGENGIVVRKRSSFMSSHRVQRSGAQRGVADEVVQPAVAAAEKSDSPARSVVVASKPSAPSPLSPQLISPPKNTAPKGKVIQWP
jgi:hypothetical protein